ncbi:unnamed protein product [Camellia sinensis]
MERNDHSTEHNSSPMYLHGPLRSLFLSSSFQNQAGPLRTSGIPRITLLGQLQQSTNTTIEVKVGVAVDINKTWDGKMGLTCISTALSDFYSSHPHSKPGWTSISGIPWILLLV